MSSKVEKISMVHGERTTISGLFHEVVNLFPNHIAVKFGDKSITYHDLDQSSRRVGNYLNQHIGLTPQPIALLFSNNLEMIPNLLGVIRSGHFYSALSTKDTPTRLRDVLIDLSPRILITDEESFSLAKEILPAGCEILPSSEIQDYHEDLLPFDQDPKALLGIFYTSGSTGIPKGVIRTHEFVLHRVKVDVNDYTIGNHDRLLYMRQFNVSSSLSSLLDALLTGATLIPFDFNTIGIDSLARILHDEKITIFPPPIEFLRHFLDSLDAGTQFPSVRCVILGGDVLFRRDVERLRPHLPENSIIIHHLSSSESSLLARTIIQHESKLDYDIVPLGFPVPGKVILILDQDTGSLMARGKSGEIAVRSEVIFPGYWQQPNLSDDKFRPDPEIPSGRVFCTGDLGYFRPDGQLVFLGRKDYQVKIRGFSIDLASIESVLMSHEGIKRAVITSLVDPRGQKRLIAYVVLNKEDKSNQRSIRDFVKSKLPEYMVPPIFLFLDDLPLTATLKVDRKALPVPDWNNIPTVDEYRPPRDDIERRMTIIWQQVLGAEKVGIDEHFFESGGDSLMVMELILQLAKDFDIHIPANLLIKNDTIRNLAPFIRQPELIHQEMLVKISLTGSELPIFLIPGGNGEIYSMLHLAKLLAGQQPIYGLQAAGEGGKHLYKQPVELIARQFLSEIKKAQSKGPFRLIGGSFGGVVAFEIAYLLRMENESVEFLGMIDTLPPGPRRKAKFITRVILHWNNIKSLPLKKYSSYLTNWWKIFLVGLARKKIFRKLFSYNKLDSAIKGSEVLRAGRTAYALYDPKPIPGDMVIFKANKRPWYMDWEPTENWKKYCLGKITIIEVEGSHGLVYKQPFVDGLARLIKKQLVITKTLR